MQTYPCEHNVVCRCCFVKTIQIALVQRTLPLRCVICREKILRLKQTQNGKLPTFQSRSSSCSSSKKSSQTVTRSCSLEANHFPGTSKYSRSLPGINSFKNRSSVNRSHSAVVYRKPAGSMRKCCRSCSLSSCSSVKVPKQSDDKPINLEQRNTVKRRIEDNASGSKKETLARKKTTTSLSREELIQQFQRDFREGQLSSRSFARAKSTKIITQQPARTAEKPRFKPDHSEKRKTCETIPENSKYRERSKKEKPPKTCKLIKLEKKDKKEKKLHSEKDCKVSKKEKRIEKKSAKIK